MISITKKEFRQQVKIILQDKPRELTKGRKAALTILAVLAGIVLTFGVTAWSCSLACSGAEVASVFMLAGAMWLIILGLVVILTLSTGGDKQASNRCQVRRMIHPHKNCFAFYIPRATFNELQNQLMRKELTSLFAMVLGLTFLFTLGCQKSTKETSADPDSVETAPNSLTAEEQAEGWELLFDGSTLNGWKRYNHDTIGPLWSVDNGAIKCDGQGLTEGTANIGGSLITIKQYGNFELVAEWKVSPGGNSGIHYHVVEKPEYSHEFDTGPEFQVMDDAGWKGDPLKEEQKAGSNYDMYAAPSTKKLNPVGEWNTAKIIYNNGHVEHWLNGEKVVEFEEGSPDFEERYKKSKWTEYPGWNKYKTGSIALQDHGAPVYFRNIKIREL